MIRSKQKQILFTFYAYVVGQISSLGATEQTLQPYSKIVYNQLENKVSYAILPNRELPERISLRFYFPTGSLHEKPNQRGLAHFIEHMAFLGSNNFPQGDMVAQCQRWGMALGPDSNAFTGFDLTVYELEMPTNTQEMLERGLQAGKDYLEGLHFPQARIGSERKVILAEKRHRDSIEWRISRKLFQFLLEGTKLPRFFPIGEEKTIRRLRQKDFFEFYRRGYNPEGFFIVVVGDIVDPREQKSEESATSSENESENKSEEALLSPQHSLNASALSNKPALASSQGQAFIESTKQAIRAPTLENGTSESTLQESATPLSKLSLAQVESLIQQYFNVSKPKGSTQTEKNWGNLKFKTGLRAQIYTEKEAPMTHLGFYYVKQEGIPDSVEKRRLKAIQSITLAAFNRRLELLIKKENSPFIEAHIDSSILCNQFEIHEFNVSCERENWQKTLALMEQTLRQALTYGFSEQELFPIKQSFLKSAQYAIDTKNTQKSPSWANRIVDAFHEKKILTSREDDLVLLQSTLETVKLQDYNKAFQALWPSDSLSIFVSGNLTLRQASKKILKAYKQSQQTAIKPYEHVIDEPFAYTEFKGAPASIIQENEIEDLQISQWILSNNCRINCKKTDFDAETIFFHVRIGGGTLENHPPGLALLGPNLLPGGLGKHSEEAINRLYADKVVRLNFDIASDAFEFSGFCKKQNLRDWLNLFCAYLTDPGYRTEALIPFQKIIDAWYREATTTISGKYNDQVMRFLANGDLRFGNPPKELIKTYSMDHLKNWLAPLLQQSALEIAIVGDFESKEDLKKQCLETLGKLPSRKEKPDFTERRQLYFTEKKFSVFLIDTEIEKTLIEVIWPTTDYKSIHTARCLDLFAEIFSVRLIETLRSSFGETYSPQVTSTPSMSFTNRGQFSVSCIVDPKRTKQVAKIIQETAVSLQQIEDPKTEQGISEDLFNRGKEPLLNRLEKSIRSNDYWVSLLSRIQENPELITFMREDKEAYNGLSIDEILTEAKKYISTDKAITILVTPKKFKGQVL